MTSKRKNPCTNWFPGSVKPVRVGVYKRLYKRAMKYCKWDRERWYWNQNTVEHAAMEDCMSWNQNLAWCGLANDPEKNK